VRVRVRVQVCDSLARATGMPKEDLYEVVDKMQVRHAAGNRA